MDYYSAIRRKKLLAHTTGWVNFKCIFLSERRKTIYAKEDSGYGLCWFFFNVYLFLRARDSMSWGGAKREGDRESQAGCSYQHRARCGALSQEHQDHDLSWSQMLNDWTTQVPPLLCDFILHDTLKKAKVQGGKHIRGCQGLWMGGHIIHKV